MGRCFQCATPVSQQYTLRLESNDEYLEKFLCDACAAGFADTDGDVQRI